MKASRTLSLSAVQQSMAPLRERWQGLAPRERLAMQLAAGLVGLALSWWLLIAPALQTLRLAATLGTELDLQLQQMRGLQLQAQALQAAPPLGTGEALRALEASVKQSLGATAQLNALGERASVSVKGISPERLAQWLAQARVNAHALPVEAHLTRSNEPGAVKWDGSIVLRLP